MKRVVCISQANCVCDTKGYTECRRPRLDGLAAKKSGISRKPVRVLKANHIALVLINSPERFDLRPLQVSVWRTHLLM